MNCFRRTDTGLNDALCVSWVEGGRHASFRRLLEKAMEWVAMVSCGAYKHRSATNSGWISIYSLRRVDRTGRLPAISRTAETPGRYEGVGAAFEPLQRRPWRYPRPDMVESFHYTVRLMSLF